MFEVRIFIAGCKGWRYWRFHTQADAQARVRELMTNGLWLKGAKRTQIYPPAQIKRIDVVIVAPTPKERKELEAMRVERMQQVEVN